ncbi:MAG: FkbM family methyltransferase [Fuerstiella sp.]|nr:FkbM family methyltransferase [Fuerstiella sp.]
MLIPETWLKRVLRTGKLRLTARRWKISRRNEVQKTPLTDGIAFEPEVKFIRELVPRNRPFFDVGANNGIYSLMVEDLVGRGNLFLFEPLPELVELLKARFGRRAVFSFALSDRESQEEIRIPVIGGLRYDTRASLEPSVMESGQTAVQVTEVSLQTLDGFVRAAGIQDVGFIKIDVEGHEMSVLKGAQHTLAKMQPLLLIEIEQRHHKQPIDSIFRQVCDLGYQGFFFDPAAGGLRNIREFNTSQMQAVEDLNSGRVLRYINNFIFVPEHHSEKLCRQVSAWTSRLF